jgi:hypothetical protein
LKVLGRKFLAFTAVSLIPCFALAGTAYINNPFGLDAFVIDLVNALTFYAFALPLAGLVIVPIYLIDRLFKVPTWCLALAVGCFNFLISLLLASTAALGPWSASLIVTGAGGAAGLLFWLIWPNGKQQS